MITGKQAWGTGKESLQVGLFAVETHTSVLRLRSCELSSPVGKRQTAVNNAASLIMFVSQWEGSNMCFKKAIVCNMIRYDKEDKLGCGGETLAWWRVGQCLINLWAQKRLAYCVPF